MLHAVSHISIIVSDQDKALDFYTKKLGLEVHTDVIFDGFRWLTVCLPGNKNFEIALLPAGNDEQQALVGKQASTYPVFSMITKDCKKTYEEMSTRGVEFIQKPEEKSWGIEALCKDLYGNIIHINQNV